MEGEEKSDLKNDLEIAPSNPTLAKKKKRTKKSRKKNIDASENCTTQTDGAEGVLEENPRLKSDVNVDSMLCGVTVACNGDTLLGVNLSPDVENGLQKDLETMHNNSELGGKRRKKKKKKKPNDSENFNINNDPKESSGLVETVALKIDVDVENVQDDPIVGVNKKKNSTKKRKRKHEVLVDNAALKSDVDVENVLDNPIVGEKKNRKKKRKNEHVLLDDNSVRADVEENSLLVENPSPLKRDVAGEISQNGKSVREDNPHLKSNVNVESVLINGATSGVRKKKTKHIALEDCSSVRNDLEEDTLLVKSPSSQVENGLSKDLEIMHNNPELGGKQRRQKRMKKLIDSQNCNIHNDFEESSVLIENTALKIDLDVEHVQDGPTTEIHKKKKKVKKMKKKHDVLDDIGVHMEDISVQDTVRVADFNESTDKMKKKKKKLIDSENCNVHNDAEESYVLLENNAALKIDLDVENVHDGPTAEIYKKKKKGKKMKSKHDVLEDIGVHMEDIPVQDTVRVADFNESTDKVNIFNNTPECAASKFVEQKNVFKDLNEEKNPSLSNMGPIGNDADLLINNRICPPQVVVVASPERSLSAHVRKKLLILDVNGLLADIGPAAPPEYKADFNVSGKKVFKRPFCVDFVLFCMEKFDVAVWSSRRKYNVNKVLNSLVGESTKDRLLFCWDQSHCTRTGFKTLDNKNKPLVLKELRKVWDCRKEYNESNTLLLDDSPYKALRNPAHTAIFPRSFSYNDSKDCSLGPGGDLRVYLEEIAACENVQEYVKKNPFGQRPITETCISWSFYGKIALVDSNKHNADAKNLQ